MGLLLRERIWRLLVVLVLLVSVTIILRTRIEGEWHDAATHQTKFGDPTRTLPSKEMKDEVLQGSIKVPVAKLFSTLAKEDLMNKTSILLPLPMDLWRRNISLDTVYSDIPPRQVQEEGACSCRNPTAAREECCDRVFVCAHKMGTQMTMKRFGMYQPKLLTVNINLLPPLEYLYQTKVDYRYVLMFRNIYDALKSGYLYHAMGMECWLDPNGRPRKNWNDRKERKSADLFTWHTVLALKVPVSLHRNRSLCEFLQEEDEKLGMRVYIDFIFHCYWSYIGPFTHWTLAQAFPGVRERTQHACYEDFNSPTKDKQAIESSLTFLFNQTTEWHAMFTDRKAYAGPHASLHQAEPDQSRRLLQIIRELDEEVFNNEIAWVDSVLPC